ncbi:SDR family NAD(P)-dependent oxidoreductase [Agrobacterium tumefaciens]|uniref:SDR family oxidoreductase n=1 Tax=Agrobacterium tumefaciens TaxID=358 RepID=UPI001297251A|nr:SDR family oxidoreductase [Agrobacterium tumefaciens]MQB35451.1 SDR family NAD(P)-dependent oxidoreductase [Agrobacterium tumefaciens]
MTHDTQPRLFVTGSTGQLGRLVIEELLKRVPASNIVAGVRSPDHEVARQFSARGVEIRVADYARPDTLSLAFEGIGRLLMISSTAGDDRVAQHQNVINAAKAADVGLVAYTSLLHADTSTSGLAEDHKSTEAALRASGLPFVLLRHGWYTENHTPSVPPALQYGAVIGCAGQGRFSSATRADYAAADAVVLTMDGHEGRVYELAGDESYDLTDLANTIGSVAGRPVTYQDMPKAKFKQALIGMGLPDVLAELIAESDIGASKGELEDHGRQLSALIGRPTTPLRQTVAASVSAA